MNPPLNTDLVDKAILFATNAHHGTERRGKGFPYIIHCLEAMTIVATISRDPELLAAAVLHDTIEDTDVTINELRINFGDRITNLVIAETDMKKTSDGKSLTWQERKLRDIKNLKNESRDAKIVTLGDKLSNMRAIARDYRTIGDDVWQIFRIKDKATHAWRYKGLRDALSDLSDTFAFQEFDSLIKEVFG